MKIELCENPYIYGDEDDDDIFDVEIIIRIRKRYTVRSRPDLFNNFDDIEFIRRFRFRKGTVHRMLSLIEEKIRSRTDRNHAVTPLHQLLLTLRYYATGTFQAVIGDLGGIHKSTMSRIIRKVTEVIASLLPQYIKFPTSNDSRRCTKTKFYYIVRFPKVLGAIDCTHVKLQSPGGEFAEVYRNRKGIFSLNVQAICDSDLKFLDIVARWPGSSHDSTIFNASRARARFINGEMEDDILLGDSACSNFLLTPLLQPYTQAQELYNESHIRTRNVIERAFGVWKQRFPALTYGLRIQPLFAQAVVVSTAILHNIAQDEGEPDPPVDFDFEAALEELEIAGIRVHNYVDNAIMRESLIDTHFSRLVR